MCNALDAVEEQMIGLALHAGGASGRLGLVPVHNMEQEDVPDGGDFGAESRINGTYRTQYLLVLRVAQNEVIPLGILYGPSQSANMLDALPDSEYVRHMFQNISRDPQNEQVTLVPPEEGVKYSNRDERVSRTDAPALPAGEPLPSFNFDALIAQVLEQANERDEPAA